MTFILLDHEAADDLLLVLLRAATQPPSTGFCPECERKPRPCAACLPEAVLQILLALHDDAFGPHEFDSRPEAGP